MRSSRARWWLVSWCRGVQDMSKAPRMIYGYLWLSNRSWSLGIVFSFHTSAWEVFFLPDVFVAWFCEEDVILNWTHCWEVLELPRVGVNLQFGMLIEELHQNGGKTCEKRLGLNGQNWSATARGLSPLVGGLPTLVTWPESSKVYRCKPHFCIFLQ